MATEPSVHVLFLEDSEADKALVMDALETATHGRYFVEHVGTMAEFAERLDSRRPDIAVIDLCVPDSVGVKTFLRARALVPDVPMIVQSGLEEEGIATTTLRNGAQDYLVKGRFDGEHLRRAVRYALERWKADLALRESEERYALASRGSNDGIWDWDLRATRLIVSPRWLNLLRLSGEARVGKPDAWLGRVHPEDQPGLATAIDDHLAHRTEFLQHEHRILREDGAYLWVRCRGVAVRDSQGQPVRMAGSMMDISAQRSHEEDLAYLAFHDSLTGLPNRALCLERIEHAMQQRARNPLRSFAVLFVDADRFKLVNDSLGHSVGDALLVAVAARLQQAVRPNDTVARLSGDEFCIVLEDLQDDVDPVRVAERIHTLMQDPFLAGDHTLYVSVSIGIAVHSDSHQQATDLLRDADMAMYRAKVQGVGRVRMSDSGLHTAAVNRLHLETELRSALQRHEFYLVYQPIVRIRDAQMVGVEALVRWQSPVRGFVPPCDFIPLAEETGLIIDLGNWVLETAIAQLAQWDREVAAGSQPLTMAINLSPRQFLAPDLVHRLRLALLAHGVAPNRIKLEITETSAMQNGDGTFAVLAELTALGVGIDLDDFGTGFSSLAYLQRMPIEVVKIDRSFVNDIENDGPHWGLVRAIVGMAQVLGKTVVAEGIERVGQWHRLHSIGCEYGQGYYFSKPMRTLQELQIALARFRPLPAPTRLITAPLPKPRVTQPHSAIEQILAQDRVVA